MLILQKMKRIVGRVFIGLLATLVIGIAVLLVTAYIYRDRIQALMMEQINQQVLVPIDIKGGISFSLIRNFPDASITLTDVSIKNKLKGGPEYLLKVHELSCLFNMWDMVHHKINVSKIHIYDGEVNVYLDAKGNANYDILKPSTDTVKATSSSAPMTFNLRKAVIKNLHLTYLSENKEEDIKIKIEHMKLSGNLSQDRFDLSTTEDLMLEQIQLNGDDYITEKSFYSDITIDVDQKQNKFTLNKGVIELAKNRFDVTGYFLSGKKSSYIDFTANTKGKDISKMIALVPVKFKSTLEGAEGSGGFEVDAKIKGSIRAGINPDIAVTARLTRATITVPRIHRPLTNVTLDAYYHYDSVTNDELWIRKFHSEFDGQPQDFDLKLTHLSDPDFVFNASGVANLHDLKLFFSDSVLQAAEGLVTFDGFHIEGSKKGLSDIHNPKFKASGVFSLKGVEIKTGGVAYSHINGRLQYTDHEASVSGFTLNFLNTDLTFDGRVTNMIAYAVSRDRAANTNDARLGFDGKLHIKTIDVGKLISAYSSPAPATAPKTPAAPAPSSSSSIDPRDIMNIQGSLSIIIDKFIYKKMIFENMRADLALSPYRIDITNLSTHTMGGDITNQGSVSLTADRKMIFDFDMNINSVDLPVLFRECENFGQTTLTDKNLKGLVTADLQIKTVWDNYTDIDLDKVEGNLNCHILKGELNDFAPVKSLAAFVKISELNHIVFSDLSNQLTIKNRVITIPMMEVQSSALNMIMAGSHTFDNIMDYQIKVNLRKLLAAKFGRKENADEYIEANPYEGVNLYLTITGSVDHSEVKYDKKSVKKKLKSDLAAQKQELQELFGSGKKHKRLKGEEVAKREDKYYNTTKKPEFIDFQEDSAKRN